MEDIIQNKNICFSCANEVSDEKRQKKYKEQRMTRGFDDTECWNLDITFCKFIIPRLKVFKEQNDGYPVRYHSKEEWDKILDDMIEGFELNSNKFDTVFSFDLSVKCQYKQDLSSNTQGVSKTQKIFKTSYNLY